MAKKRSENRKYYDHLKKIYKKPEDYELVGKNYTRVDAGDKVTGRAKFTDDIMLPGMLYGRLKRSPYAHAKIISIDTSKAEALSGVKCIITGKDFPPNRKLGNPEAFKELADKDPLCRDEVRFVGDEVAAVAAVDEETALEAIDLIEVVYEELPFVLNATDAMKDDAPAVHYPGTHNISMFTTMQAGDCDKAFAEADYTDKHNYTTQMVVHASIEPHGTVAKWENNELTVWTTTQGLYVSRFWIAYGLGLPLSQVRVVKPFIGGGFGGKLDAFPHELCACLMAMKTGRPVKIVLSREEVFYGTRSRHPIEFEIKSAFKQDGTMLAKRCQHVLEGGAYGGSGIAANLLSLIFATLPYRVPNIDMTARRPYTNKPASGAMRGYSSCQVHFAHDVHMDEVAEELGIDPVELRRINACVPGYLGPTGLQITSCAFIETLDKASEAIHWEERKNNLKPGEGIGIGGSGFVSGTGFPVLVTPSYSSASTVVRLNREGYATVFTSANEIGQGSDTVMTTIVAEELGLKMDEVKLVQADTTHTPFDSGSFGSRVTFLAGNATRRAVGDAKFKLLEVVAENWGCKPEDITMKDHQVFKKGDPEKNISYGEAIWMYEEKHFGKSIVGVGSYAHEGSEEVYRTNIGNYAPAYSFSTGAARVEVDEETGCINVSDLAFAHDCGRPLNIRAVEGQVEGSVQMGLGFTLFEECLFDDNGKMLNPTFRDYRFPTALDMPRVQTILCGEPDEEGTFGAKEAGEGTTAPVGPAIVNAINRATGIKFHHLPLTPEKVWRAIKEKKAAEAAKQ